MHQYQELTKSASKYEHSPKIAERRRALFPSNDNNTDDLGQITPIADKDSPENNLETCANKDPKARTNLFPESDITVPTKTFYPKSDNSNKPPVSKSFIVNSAKQVTSRHAASRSRRGKFGQINAGVSHKIRKPKKPEVSKKALLDAALNIIDNSPLNGYFKKLEEHRSKPEIEADKNDPDDKALLDYMEELNRIKSPKAKQIMPAVKKDAPIVNIPDTASGAKEDDVSLNQSPTTENKRKFFKSLKQQNLNGFLMNKSAADKAFSDSEDEAANTETEPLISTDKVDDILTMLDEKENLDSTRAIGVPEQPKSKIVISPGKQVQQQNQNVLLSPTTMMCDMTLGLALNSPKKVKNLSLVLNSMPSGATKRPSTSPAHKAAGKRFKSLPPGQMLLDAGQKRWGTAQCGECNFLYHMGDPGDEMLHLDYHNASHILRFNGWKNEKIVANLADGKILHLVPGDSKLWWKKINQLVEFINRDLGYFEMQVNLDFSQVFICIKGHKIVGCLVAETKHHGRKMLTNTTGGVDLCSEETYPVKCGVSRIWVSQPYRKQKIATYLMACLKKNFMNGYVLSNEDIALSAPTEAGRLFATKYFGTPNFLIYDM